MCGIIGTVVKQPRKVKGRIMNLYHAQKKKGSNGFGITIQKLHGLSGKPTILRVRTKTFKEIRKAHIWGLIERGDVVIFHHRIPTSTPNLEPCNHPFLNEDSSIALAHNGIVNYAGVFTGVGHVYESAITQSTTTVKNYLLNKIDEVTDSEHSLHYLEELSETKSFIDAMYKLGEESNFSTFLISKLEEQKLYFISNNQCLGSRKYKSEIYLYSDGMNSLRNKLGYLDVTGIHIEKTFELNPTRSRVVSSYNTNAKSNVNSYGGYAGYGYSGLDDDALWIRLKQLTRFVENDITMFCRECLVDITPAVFMESYPICGKGLCAKHLWQHTLDTDIPVSDRVKAALSKEQTKIEVILNKAEDEEKVATKKFKGKAPIKIPDGPIIPVNNSLVVKPVPSAGYQLGFRAEEIDISIDRERKRRRNKILDEADKAYEEYRNFEARSYIN